MTRSHHCRLLGCLTSLPQSLQETTRKPPWSSKPERADYSQRGGGGRRTITAESAGGVSERGIRQNPLDDGEQHQESSVEKSSSPGQYLK